MRTSSKAVNIRLIVAISFTAAVVAVVIGGILLLDSPAEERSRRLDERRVDDLRSISAELDFYWTRERTLPSSLEELADEPGVFLELYDPESGEAYEYRVLSSNTYELCAEFARDTAEERNRFYTENWSHGPGKQCFELEAQDVERPMER